MVNEIDREQDRQWYRKELPNISIDTFTDQPVEVSLRATWLLESILFLLHVVADIKIVARSSGLSLVMHNNKRDDHRSRAENDSVIFCEFLSRRVTGLDALFLSCFILGVSLLSHFYFLSLFLFFF